MLGLLKSGTGAPETLLHLRWILIVATAYLLLFHRPLSDTPPAVAVFVAAYLASNFVVGYLLPRVRAKRLLNTAIVLFDTGAVSIGLLLTQGASTDFLLLYFVVMLVGALTERLEAVVGAAVLISFVHFFTAARFVGVEHLISSGELMRIPFLFVVALFFGHLVQRTRQAEREAAEARLHERRQKEIVAEITHDLKNPLGVIRGMAQLLLEADGQNLTPQQSDFIRRIHHSAQRVITLSLNLLDANRIDTGRLMLRPAHGRLEDIVEEAFSLARSAAELRNVTLDLEVTDPDLPPVRVDAVHMGRVVWNLIDNAIKYTPPGGRVLVSVGREADWLTVKVADTGRGIPSDRLATIFERDHESNGSEIGSGLGLFIVRAITEVHGGSVRVDSLPGQGTCFTVRLPEEPKTEWNGQAPVAALTATS